MEYVVFTEYFNGTEVERWYYGTYDRNMANEVVHMLGSEDHGIVREDEAKEWGILNMPR